MIIYIFNHYFPDPSGFGRRILREVRALSESDEVTIICRKSKTDQSEEYLKLDQKRVKIVRYSAKSKIVHRPVDYQGNGLYEIQRNLDILFQSFFTLIKTIRDQKKSTHVKVFAVSSPLTVPMIAWFACFLTRTEATLVSFHDLEPELAMHIKKLNPSHWIVRLEYLLESFVCNHFKKVLVTTEGQAKRIISRTGISPDRICAIPNTSELSPPVLSKEPRRNPNKFVLGYMSTLSFDYTVDGLKKLLHEVPAIKAKMPNFEFLVIGGGDSLGSLQKLATKLNIDGYVRFTGHIENPVLLLTLDAAIIPWEKDIMTETILPTKLFEYMSLGIAIVAPNFGEFKRFLINDINALLYESIYELEDALEELSNYPMKKLMLGQNGKELYEKYYSIQHAQIKYLDFLKIK